MKQPFPQVRSGWLLAAWAVTAGGWWAVSTAWLPVWVGRVLTAPEQVWYGRLALWLYPRLLTEKERLPIDFFVEKATQTGWRAMFVLLLLTVTHYLLSGRLADWWVTFWQPTLYPQALTVCKWVLYPGMLWFSWEWYSDLPRMAYIAALYTPSVWWLPTFPSPAWVLVLVLLYYTGVLMALLHIWPVTGAIIAGGLFASLQGLTFGFGTTDHSLVTLCIASLLMPFWLANPKATWVWQLVRVVVVSAYLLSGLEKCWVSGIEWLSPAHLTTYLWLGGTEAGLWLVRYPFWVGVLAGLTILFQLTFPVVLWQKKWVYVYLPVGLLFHASTSIFLGVGPLFSAWVVLYVFFLPVNQLFLRGSEVKNA